MRQLRISEHVGGSPIVKGWVSLKSAGDGPNFCWLLCKDDPVKSPWVTLKVSMTQLDSHARDSHAI